MSAVVLQGRYALVQELGRGGLGSVWQAVDQQLDTQVAVKRLHREYSADAGLQRRLRREARAVARMDHPNIVRLLDVGDHDGAFLVMELVSGLPLDSFAASRPSAQALLDVCDQILGALAYAHARGVIHRDLKPDNVLVTRRAGAPRVKLLDFGFAWVEDDLDDDISLATRNVFGTPHYMAPEQAMRDEEVGAPADLYAVGVMIWELLCGAPPFDGETGASVLIQHLNAELPPFKPRADLELPHGFEAWLTQALEKDPQRRFHSAGAMRRAMMSLVTHESPTLEMALPALTTTDAFTGLSLDGSIDTGSIATLTGSNIASAETSPIIGRDDLRRWLWTHVVAVCSMPAPPRIVILEGAAGMGRTRLCTWLCQAVAEGGWMSVATGRRRVGAPSALRAALRAALNVGDPLPNERIATLAARLAQLGGVQLDPAVVAPCLWPEMGPCPPTRSRRVVEHVIRRLARRQPLLLCLDDLTDAGDIDLVEHLVVALDRRPAPVLLLCTRRDLPLMGQPTAAGLRVSAFVKRRQELLHVGRVPRLGADAIEAIVQQALLVHPDIARHVARGARGNPLVARQILAWLRESGAIAHDSEAGLYRFVGLPPRMPSQPALLVAERVRAAFDGSGQPSQLHGLCRHLALVGDAFAFDLVSKVASRLDIGHGELVAAVDTLASIGVVVDAAEDTLAFSNSLFRDIFLAEAESSVDPGGLHQIVADAKAEWYRGHGELAASELARHYLAAEQPERAAQYQLIAARHARDALQLKVAMARFAEAERWLSAATPRSGLRRQALVGLADVVLDLRQAERALRIADQIARLTAEIDDRVGQLMAFAIRGEALLALGRITEAEKVLARAARAATPHADVAARIALARGRAAIRQNDPLRARVAVQASIQMAQLVAPRAEAKGWQMLGELALKGGDRAEAVAALEKAAALVSATFDEPLRGAVNWRLGELHRRAGDFEAAIPHFTAAADAFETAGNQSSLGRSLRGLGDAQWAEGDPAARQSYRRAIAAFTPLADAFQLAVCYTQLGRAEMEAREFEAAEAALERATAHLEPLGDMLRMGLVHVFRAEIAQAQGLEGARDLYLESALECDRQQPMVVPEWAQALERLAAIIYDEQPERGRRLLTRAETVWRALGRDERADRIQQRLAQGG